MYKKRCKRVVVEVATVTYGSGSIVFGIKKGRGEKRSGLLFIRETAQSRTEKLDVSAAQSSVHLSFRLFFFLPLFFPFFSLFSDIFFVRTSLIKSKKTCKHQTPVEALTISMYSESIRELKEQNLIDVGSSFG